MAPRLGLSILDGGFFLQTGVLAALIYYSRNHETIVAEVVNLPFNDDPIGNLFIEVITLMFLFPFLLISKMF